MAADASQVAAPEAVYTYTDERDRPLFEVLRYPGKHFVQRQPDGDGGYIYNLDNVRRVPYRLNEVALAEQVFLVEGEKDVESLRALELVGTTNPGGANGWRTEYAELLRGKHVVILPDQDTPGQAWARRIERDLAGVAASVKTINLPGLELGSGADVSDWLASSHTKKELLALAERAPAVQPTLTPRSASEGGNSADHETDAESSHKKQGSRRSQSSRIADAAESAELFHATDGTCYAAFTVGKHRETWALRSTPFRRFLTGLFFIRYRAVPGSQAIQDALNLLEFRALFLGPEHPVFTRVADRGDTIWIDLADPDWRAVQVTSLGWDVVENPPVRFRRSRGMLALPVPVPRGTIGELLPFLNLSSEQDRALVLSWLVAAVRPRGPYPILCLHGEQGTTKSTMARVLRALIDPNVAPLRTLPREERDLQISARNSHLMLFDNVSRLDDWISDGLCRLSTGGGLATRQLYTDDEEVLFDAYRPVLLNGIEELAAHGDFLDRSIIIYLPQITETARRDESQFWADFEKARPRILGALLDAVSSALRNIGTVKLERKPRMADFAIWAVAAEPALGIKSGTFLPAYDRNRKEAHRLALEDSQVAPYLCDLMGQTKEWRGAVADLLQELGKIAGEEKRKQKGWPRSARALSGTLRRLAPTLRAVGVVVTFVGREAHRGRSLVRLEKVGETSSPSSPSSPAQEQKDLGGEGQLWRPSQRSSPDLHPVTVSKQTSGEGGEEGEGVSGLFSKLAREGEPRGMHPEVEADPVEQEGEL